MRDGDLSHAMNSDDGMRIIVNWDENCMWDYFFARKKPAVNNPAIAKQIIEEIIDEHAAAEVDTVVHCFFGAGFKGCVWESKVAECLIGTEAGVKLRPPALDEAGVDFLRVIMDRCHKHGMKFLAGLRMNDRHGFTPDKFAKEHPEWNLNMNGGGFDFTYEGVRKHLLEFVEEILAKYEVDGIECDYMRWCHVFPRGEGSKRAHLLTDFTVNVRKLLDDAAKRRGGTRLELGVRIPQTMEECEFLGFDVATWIKLGAVDYVSPMDFFYIDYNAKTEDFAKLTTGTNCKIYPSISPMVCWGSGQPTTLANYRAAARNFYAYGADGLSPYNYQLHWNSSGMIAKSMHKWPAAMHDLKELRDLQKIEAADRHYLFFPLWHGQRASETGFYHDDNIYITRSKPLAGSRRFRMAENFGDPGLKITIKFKAVGLEAAEHLEIRINQGKVPDSSITRVLHQDGCSGSGRVFAPYYQYVIDMSGDKSKHLLLKGDNELWVKLTPNETKKAGKLSIDELEAYVCLEK